MMFLGVRDPGHQSVMFLKSWFLLDLTQVRFISQRMWPTAQFSFSPEPLLPGPFLPMCQSTSLSYPCVYPCTCLFIFSVVKQTTSFLDCWSSNIPYWVRQHIQVHEYVGALNCFFSSSVQQNGFMKEHKQGNYLELPSLHWSCYLQLPFPTLSQTIWSAKSIVGWATIQKLAT